MANEIDEGPASFHYDTIRLQRPTDLKNFTNKVLRSKLLLPLVKLTSGSRRAEGLVEIATELTSKDQPEEAAWKLVYSALKKTVDEIVNPLIYIDKTTVTASIDINHRLQQSEEQINLDQIDIQPNFPDNPRNLKLLEPMAKALTIGLKEAGIDDPTASAAVNRLPNVFAHNFDELCHKQTEAYDHLYKLTKSDHAKATQQTRAWSRYQRLLAYQLEQPLFADKFSLRDLYQPPHAYRLEKIESGTRAFLD